MARRANFWLVRYWAYEDSKYVHIYAPNAVVAKRKARDVLRRRWRDFFGWVDMPSEELPEFPLDQMDAVELGSLQDGEVIW
jgi:hypothetical protein